MGTPFLGEMKIVSFNFAPQGWAFCNGQFLPINQNQALFAILGTQYGGNGQTTFALPDLRGRVPIHFGSGFNVGERAGQEAHTLIMSEMPAHNHFLNASNISDGTNLNVPGGNYPGNDPQNPYRSTANTTMFPGSVTNVGGSQAHTNMQPILVLNVIIALVGVFPSQT